MTVPLAGLPNADLDRTLLTYVVRVTWPAQAVILAATLAALPFYYLSLEAPKAIVNQVFEAKGLDASATIGLFGITFGKARALQALLALALVYLASVAGYQLLKMFVNIYKGLLTERVIKRLRARLYTALHHLPAQRLAALGGGSMVAMTVMEAEPIGGFCGDIVALPALQGGLMLTAVGFIFAQDPLLGAGALILLPLQAWIFPRLVARRTALETERVGLVRRLSDAAEDLAAARLAEARPGAAVSEAEFEARADVVRRNRVAIYRNKFSTYFFLNFANQVTPFLYYMVGGWFVLEGRITTGALVAIIAAYRDLTPPWEELLYWWQDARIVLARYRQITAVLGEA